MAIKAGLGRLELPASVEEYVAEKVTGGFSILPVDWPHAAAVERLPLHHRDLFDRLLAAQALAEKLPLVSSDPVFRTYGVKVVW
jgi:PIN domain nuclease of toxin-antitoxin system